MVHDDVVAGTPDGNAEVVLRLLAAFTAQDRPTIENLLDPDCVWRVPGDNALAGEYVGRAKVMELFGVLKRLFTGPARFEVVDVTVEDDRVTLQQYVDIDMGGRGVRMKERLVFRCTDGRVVEVEEFQDDQAAFDQVFSRAAVAPLLNR